MIRQRARGFTLIEVVVAITVGVIALTLAHATLEESTAAIARVRAQRQHLDRRSNGRRFLHAVFASVETGSSATAFHGSPDAVELTTWLPGPAGRFERRAVTLRVRSDSLVATLLPSSDPPARRAEYVLETGVVAIGVDYLPSAGAATPWLSEWESEVTLPLAVRVRLRYYGSRSADTLLLVVGTRG